MSYCSILSENRPNDRSVAISRMQAAGVNLATAESLIFDLMGSAEHPQFKTISGIIKEQEKGIEYPGL